MLPAEWKLALRERPDDDGLLLVLADWLEERGGESAARGEFVRLQCRPGVRRGAFSCRTALMAQLHYESWEPPADMTPAALARERGVQRACRLLCDWCPVWLAGVDPHLAMACRWRRGVVIDAEYDLGGWLLHGPALAGLEPLLSRADVVDRKPQCQTVDVAPPRTPCWTWLRLTGGDYRQNAAHFLPAAVFDRLPRVLPAGAAVQRRRANYGTEEGARLALSAAVLGIIGGVP